ncbi:MAG: hypothetical protein Q4D41_04190 [Prevotellaceae bacterium]|nr:hypothetical protein [Prevotellaceae bacterium]
MKNLVPNRGKAEYSVADLLKEIEKAQRERAQRNQLLTQALAVLASSEDPKIRKAVQTVREIAKEMSDEYRELLSMYRENGR